LPSFCTSTCLFLRNFRPVVMALLTRALRPAVHVSCRLRRLDASFVRVLMVAAEVKDTIWLTG